jgi:hypothetical protein
LNDTKAKKRGTRAKSEPQHGLGAKRPKVKSLPQSAGVERNGKQVVYVVVEKGVAKQ